jgi:hypothetical protein
VNLDLGAKPTPAQRCKSIFWNTNSFRPTEATVSNQQTPPTNEQIEHTKWLEELNRQDAHRAHDKLEDFHTYVNKGAVQTGQSALRMSMLINGGAAVSLLTFIGTLPKEQKHLIADSLVWFASGVALAVAAIAASYFADLFMAAIASSQIRTFQHPYVQPGPNTKRLRCLNTLFHILAVVLGLVSLGTFVYGLIAVRHGFASVA